MIVVTVENASQQQQYSTPFKWLLLLLLPLRHQHQPFNLCQIVFLSTSFSTTTTTKFHLLFVSYVDLTMEKQYFKVLSFQPQQQQPPVSLAFLLHRQT